jgi:hypothetical protein
MPVGEGIVFGFPFLVLTAGIVCLVYGGIRINEDPYQNTAVATVTEARCIQNKCNLALSYIDNDCVKHENITTYDDSEYNVGDTFEIYYNKNNFFDIIFDRFDSNNPKWTGGWLIAGGILIVIISVPCIIFICFAFVKKIKEVQ